MGAGGAEARRVLSGLAFKPDLGASRLGVVRGVRFCGSGVRVSGDDTSCFKGVETAEVIRARAGAEAWAVAEVGGVEF